MKTEDRAEDQAAAQYASIEAMIAAVGCDYERLHDLRELKNQADQCGNDAGAGDDDPVISGAELDELAELEAAAADCEDEDDAINRIQEDALSVDVRSDWTAPGTTLEAGEFQILLCTGGPAVRIIGELDRGEPVRAWLEYQDWGTSWTRYYGASSDTLCKYAAHFYFGD